MSEANPTLPIPDPLSRKERRWLAALAVFFVLVGLTVEFRGICQERVKGDLMVFLRTAWAVRSGRDIYTTVDHNGWHYHYPPLLAILLTPLANPPPFDNMPWTMPYSASLFVWFALSVLFLCLGVHLLASALEEATGRKPERWGRRWWAWRVVPIVACLPPIAHTLIRGQVGLLLLLLVCGATAALVRKRSVVAGYWLAGAICLKVIPAFLLIYPVWRRDLRCLIACAAGLVVGLGLIPAAVFGPERTAGYYREWAHALLLPALAEGDDHARDKELINVTATHSQSFLPVLHNLQHPVEAQRPAEATQGTRLAHFGIAGLFTLLTLVVVGRRPDSGVMTVLFVGALVLLMILTSPICHSHYFVLSVPIVMGLLASFPERPGEWVNPRLRWLLGLNVVANFLPLLDGMEIPRDFGIITLMALALWLTACGLLWRRPTAQVAAPAETPRLAA